MRRLWSRMARSARSEQGFTLIELLVVIAILAVIAAVAIPRVTQTTDAARATRNQANTSIIQSAVERYHLDKGSYPIVVGSTTSQIDFDALMAGDGYLSQKPKDNTGNDDTAWYLDTSGHVTRTPQSVVATS